MPEETNPCDNAARGVTSAIKATETGKTQRSAPGNRGTPQRKRRTKAASRAIGRNAPRNMLGVTLMPVTPSQYFP